MIKAPIWKDTYYNSQLESLDYAITTTGYTVLHQGYTKKMPGTTGVTLDINNKVDEYLKPDLDSDITDANGVIGNSNAIKRFYIYRDFNPDWYPMPTPEETFEFLYNWSYEDDWTGQTQYVMSEPINKHLDPRMKLMYTMLSGGTINWSKTSNV